MTEQESEIDIEGERYVLCREACVNEMNSSLNISRTLPDPERTWESSACSLFVPTG